MVAAARPHRRLTRNPLFNVALLLQNFPRPPIFSDALEVSLPEQTRDAALLDLRVVAQRRSNGLELLFEYSAELFEPRHGGVVRERVRRCARALCPPAGFRGRGMGPAEGPRRSRLLLRRRLQGRQLALAATFTTDPVERALDFWSSELELPWRVVLAPYNQVLQQLLDPTSALGRNRDGLDVVLIRLSDFLRDRMDGGAELVRRRIAELVLAAEAAAGRLEVPLLIVSCPAAAGDAGLDAAAWKSSRMPWPRLSRASTPSRP